MTNGRPPAINGSTAELGNSVNDACAAMLGSKK
jgi:hypothetical protein